MVVRAFSDFNPRTRVGCDQREVIDTHEGGGISIHAPAWGATRAPGQASERGLISIHAPAWGATSIEVFLTLTDGFQSTHPRGVRP